MRLLLLLFLASCVSRKEVEGQLWLFDKIPDSICKNVEELKYLGVYRVVSCKDFPNPDRCSNGEKEYELAIPYCSNRILKMKAAENHVIEAWLKKLGRPK